MTTSGPLKGVKIVEFPAQGPVPLAGMLLGQLGAEVIQLRRPGPRSFGDEANAANKQFLVADLKDPEMCRDVHSLLIASDAIIEGFRPGVLERLGFDPQVLLAEKPSLVIGRMTGWGQEGPLSQVPGHDLNYLAITGILDAIGYADRPPTPPLALLGDMAGGALYLVAGILSALLHSERTGEGQIIDCAMVDGILSLSSAIFELRNQGHWKDSRQSNIVDGAAPFYRVYECADGRCLALCPIEPKFFAAAAAVLNLDTQRWEGRYAPENWPSLVAELENLFRQRTRDEWLERFAGTEACVSPVLSFEEAIDNAQLRARASFIETGSGWVSAPAPRFSKTPGNYRQPVEYVRTNTSHA